MKTAAIICEYNPFHKGHLLQIELIKRTFGSDTVIISLMSGNSVQRGMPAIYPKYQRAKAAILCGADLVLELPCQYSCASAEYFARGAVNLLSSLGQIDLLCFGSECGSLESLNTVSKNLCSERFISVMKNTQPCDSHARLSQSIYTSLYGEGYPTKPNDILAVEYLTALRLGGSKIKPFTYKREEGFSATSSRAAIYSGDSLDGCIPSEALSVLSELVPTDLNIYGGIALNTLLSESKDCLEKYSGMNGGVSGLLGKCALACPDFNSLIAAATGKSYTSSRLRRAIMSSLLKITDADRKERPLYTSLLSASKRGCEYLASVKKTSGICIVTKPSDYNLLPPDAIKQYEIGLRCDRLFHICRRESPSLASTAVPFIKK